MDTNTLQGRKVAILVAEGFEQVELTEPKAALERAGARASIVSPSPQRVQGWNHFDKADRFPVDVPLKAANSKDFDALLLPGGVAKPDQCKSSQELCHLFGSSSRRGSRLPPSVMACGH